MTKAVVLVIKRASNKEFRTPWSKKKGTGTDKGAECVFFRLCGTSPSQTRQNLESQRWVGGRLAQIGHRRVRLWADRAVSRTKTD